MEIRYNTSKNKLVLPAYGRLIQQMVEHAMLIPQKEGRQLYAEKIIRVMSRIRPEVAARPEANTILWEDLAYISNYQLDIDYPCTIVPKSPDDRPERLPYPGSRIRMKHYGHLTETALLKLRERTPGTPDYERLAAMMAIRMKRNLNDWRGDGREDEKVARDMELYTEGLVSQEESLKAIDRLGTKMNYHSPRPRFIRKGRR